MKKLNHSDGSWASLLKEWSDQCHQFSEDFQSYAPETIELLGQLVEDTENQKWDGVFAMKGDDGATTAICFVNGAFIPKFVGRVMRVRHILLSPKADFGEYDPTWYAETLGKLFDRIIEVSDSHLSCRHVKIHFRSPADLALFRSVKSELDDSEHFSSVNLAGAWLILSKNEDPQCAANL